MTGNSYYVFRQVNHNPWERMGPFDIDMASTLDRQLRAGQDPNEVKVKVCVVKPGEMVPRIPYGE